MISLFVRYDNALFLAAFAPLRELFRLLVAALPRRDSPHDASAIHDHRLAGDKRRRIAGQKHCGSN
jgi:hypothetical protein